MAGRSRSGLAKSKVSLCGTSLDRNREPVTDDVDAIRDGAPIGRGQSGGLFQQKAGLFSGPGNRELGTSLGDLKPGPWNNSEVGNSDVPGVPAPPTGHTIPHNFAVG